MTPDRRPPHEGRSRLARLPIDPRLGRMILEAERLGCLREVLVIAAALSIQDPRERPAEQRGAGRPAARPLQHESQRLPHLAQPLALHQAAAARAVRRARSAGCASASTSTTCASASGRTSTPSCARWRKEMKLDVGPPVGHPRRGRHPPGAARPACSPTSARSRSARRASRASGARCGVPRRPRRPLRDLPRQRAEGAQPRLPDGRRAGRDLAAVGAGRTPRIEPEWAERARRPPGQAHLLRAALVAQARGGDGPRAGHAVRRPARRRPPRPVRPDRPAARPRAVHPARARPGRVGHPPPVLRRQHARCSRRSRSSSTGPDAATSSSTRRRSSTFYDARVGEDVVSGRTSTSGGSARGRSSPTCSPSTPRCSPTTRPARCAPTTSRRSGTTATRPG